MSKAKSFYFIDAQGGLHAKDCVKDDVVKFEARGLVDVSPFLGRMKVDLSTLAGSMDVRTKLGKDSKLPDEVKAALAVYKLAHPGR